MNRFMKAAVEEALSGLRQNRGGPFGAVVIRNGKIVARAHNEVIRTNDPTAHAEIVAIRKAAARLKHFDLSACEIYSTCEPCPMCLAAIHWASIRKLHYGVTKKDASKIGFDDELIYGLVSGKGSTASTKKRRRLMIEANIERKKCLEPFKAWEKKANKVRY